MLKKLFQEVVRLNKAMFRRDLLNFKVLEQPEDLKKLNLRLNISNFLVLDLISNFFAYLLILANHFIEIGIPVLGIICYFLYVGKDIIRSIYRQYLDDMRTTIDFSTNDTLSIIGGTLINKVSFKVYQEENNYYKQVSNDALMNSCGRYLSISWKIRNQYWFNILKLISVLVMLVGTIKTNTSVPQKVFIPLLLISASVSYLTTLADCLVFHNYAKTSRDIDRQKDTLKNDFLRVIPIIPYDQEIRIRRYRHLSSKALSNEKGMKKQNFVTDILSTVVQILASYILIVLILGNTKTVTLETIATLTASLAVFNAAIDSCNSIIRILQRASDDWDRLDKEKELILEILSVYHKHLSQEKQAIESLDIAPFAIGYEEKSENDRPFTLQSESLHFAMGDVIALTGSSGSGKSTFGKLVTNRITFNHIEGNEIFPTNYMFFDETIGFGSLSLYEEIFCLEEISRPVPSLEELSKMEEIMRNLFIWKEISESCKDVWQWLKEHNSRDLSNGQRQRLILSKILFWLNDDIDIIMLDECTSGLDEENNGNEQNADAIRVLQYVIDYCNQSRPRILFVSTHQNVETLCNRQLHFRKYNGRTIIQEIS